MIAGTILCWVLSVPAGGGAPSPSDFRLLEDAKEARAEAKRTGRPLVLYVTSDG
ncbi:MAG TPA: hypothetical protein VKF62_12175 [Planctomycetota bacterium]|nr:hypothetical protein [Planctomycetota bacterium]